MLLQNPRRTAFLLVPLALAGVTLTLRGGMWIAPAQAQQASPRKTQAADRPDDRAAIRSAMQSFVKAFESRNAQALGAHWTAEGEFKSEAGQTIRGRDGLVHGFSQLFAKTPEVKAEVQPESLRFLSSDTAIEEGSVTVRRGSAEPTTRAHYNVLFVRENGRWLIAQLSESPAGGPSIADLAWLIGEWKSTSGQGAEIRTTYSWAPSKKFIHAQFSIKEKALALAGFQVIGVDPETKAIHTWTFEADGGVGEASWNPDGDHWVLDADGTLADGSALSETNILRRVNADTFTWQSIDRMHDDDELPDLAPVKVTRVKTEK
jgi:uncharacterized protein (TIGR02246 family)